MYTNIYIYIMYTSYIYIYRNFQDYKPLLFSPCFEPRGLNNDAANLWMFPTFTTSCRQKTEQKTHHVTVFSFLAA